jgi:hypothetical protein
VALVAAIVAAACLMVVVASAGARPVEAQSQPQPPAVADNPLTYVTEDSPSNAGRSAKLVAKCPSGHRVISGGFDLRDRLGTPWTIYESRPSGIGPTGRGEPSDAWVVVATTVERNPKPFTAYAVCAPEFLVPPGSIDYPNRTEPVPAGQVKEITPPCRPSYQAIGGGFAMLGPLFLVRSQPNPGNGFRSWIVVASVLPNYNGNLSAYSVCVREELVRSLEFSQGEAKGRTMIDANTERCPRGTYLLGGGGGTNERNAPYVNWSHMRPAAGAQANPPSTWSTGAIKREIRGAPEEITVNAHSMCGRLDPEEPDYPLKIVTEASSREWTRGTVLQAATCPSDHTVIGGGFDTLRYGPSGWYVRESYPSISGRSWRVEAWSEPGTSRNSPFAVYAVCAPESLLPRISVEYPQSSRQVDRGSRLVQLTPDCRPDYRAIGGGFRKEGESLSLVRTQPNPGNGFRSWIVGVFNGDQYKGGQVTAYSVCVPQELMTPLQHYDDPVTGWKNGSVTANSRPCRGDAYLLSGGAGTPTPSLDNFRDGWLNRWLHIRPVEGAERPSWLNWSGSAVVASGVPPTVHAHALCGRFLEEPGEEPGEDNGKRVLIDHKGKELCVPKAALKGHLRHGDEVISEEGCSNVKKGRSK